MQIYVKRLTDLPRTTVTNQLTKIFRPEVQCCLNVNYISFSHYKRVEVTMKLSHFNSSCNCAGTWRFELSV